MALHRMNISTFPNSGWKFRDEHLQWDAPQPMINGFKQQLKNIIKERLKHPEVVAKHKLAIDAEAVGKELLEFTCLRLGLPAPMGSSQSIFIADCQKIAAEAIVRGLTVMPGRCNFSLILNTRGRKNQLIRTIESFERNTTDKQGCELLITADEDDTETTDYLHRAVLENTPGIRIKTFIGQRPKNLSVTLNHMALHSVGRFVFVLNDDAEMLTPGWDKIALDKFEAFKKRQGCKDDVLYGLTSDNSVDHVPNTVYACFPIISAEAIRALGFVMYPELIALGGDSSIYRVYQRIGRVVPMQEITFDHVYHRTNQAVHSPDKTAAEMRDATYRYRCDPFGMSVDSEVKKLSDLICGV